MDSTGNLNLKFSSNMNWPVKLREKFLKDAVNIDGRLLQEDDSFITASIKLASNGQVFPIPQDFIKLNVLQPRKLGFNI